MRNKTFFIVVLAAMLLVTACADTAIDRRTLVMRNNPHVTKIDFGYEADAWFPNLDEKPEWKITADSEEQTYFDLEFYFYKYERVQK